MSTCQDEIVICTEDPQCILIALEMSKPWMFIALLKFGLVDVFYRFSEDENLIYRNTTYIFICFFATVIIFTCVGKIVRFKLTNKRFSVFSDFGSLLESRLRIEPTSSP